MRHSRGYVHEVVRPHTQMVIIVGISLGKNCLMLSTTTKKEC